MPDQVSYYNLFGEKNEESILSCPEPEYWTTDYRERGRIYQEMKLRVETQKNLFADWFKTTEPVLDIGCGFGRQSILLAKLGFLVKGTDTSASFINIAKKIFARLAYKGEFIQADLLKENSIVEKFSQIILLDVLEHIKPRYRRTMLEKISALSSADLILIISLPKTRDRFFSVLNNRVRKAITQYIRYFFSKEEHPYPIPGKKQMMRLTKDHFRLVKFESSVDSDFYVFQKAFTSGISP